MTRRLSARSYTWRTTRLGHNNSSNIIIIINNNNNNDDNDNDNDVNDDMKTNNSDQGWRADLGVEDTTR